MNTPNIALPENSYTKTPWYHSTLYRIILLSILHLIVDFFGGLLIPLPDPTLMSFFHSSLAKIMLIVSGTALLVNFIQPLAGFALAEKHIPNMLIFCSLAAGAVSLIGLSDNYWVFTSLLVVAGTGVGLMHPEATMILHSITDKKTGFATSIFMSCGFLGFSIGSLVGGYWGQLYGLKFLWMLFPVTIILALAIRISGLHNIKHSPEKEKAKEVHTNAYIPFSVVIATAMMIAVNLAILYRLLPIFYIRKFGDNVQFMAGSIPFYIGLSGAAGAFIWGYLSDYRGCGILLLPLYLLGMPFFYFILHTSSVSNAILPALLFGFTIGGSFPLTIVLAKNVKNFSMRLRMGLCIGGAWGLGEILVIAASKYIDTFPATASEGVFNVLQLLWIPMTCIVCISTYLIILEKKQINNDKEIS